MMTKEEKAIRNIKRFVRQRKLRIVLLVGVVAFFIWCDVWVISKKRRFDTKISPELFRSMSSYENYEHEMPILLSRVYTLSACNAKLMFSEIYFGSITGLLIAFLIIEIAGGFNRPYLTLSMWERIEKLEAEISRLRSQPDTEDQHPPADSTH